MATKRMFSIDVTETDTFLEMPLTAQALYFHLGMRGEDDGFVSSPRATMRAVGCSEEDLNALKEAGYIIVFHSGVLVITDWKVNNYLRGDRHKPTTFQNELSLLSETANKRYVLSNGNQVPTIGIPDGNQLETQYSKEKNRVAAGKTTAAPRTDSDLAEIVQHFERVIGLFPRSALDKLQRYRDSIPTEVICKAFDEAAESGHRSWKYANGILKSWQADGVRTLGDVEARRASRKKPGPQPERKLEALT